MDYHPLRPSRLLLGLIACLSAVPAFAAVPSATELHRLLEERLACAQAPGGMVAGVIDHGERVVVGAGKANDSAVVPDGDTLFEIASVSKLFTGILLADAVQRGELELDQPMAALLPQGVSAPAGGGAITLRDLSTHYSGLPTDPAGHYKPGQTWTVDQGWATLSKSKLEQAPGQGWRYSNFGVAVLGNLIAQRAGTDYASLLQQRIAQPLGLVDTVVTVDAQRSARLATGYDRRGRPLPPTVGLEPFPGATEIRSTANDLLRFMAAGFAAEPAPLAAAFALATSTRRSTGPNGHEAFFQGLGFDIEAQGDRALVFHGGWRVDGFGSYIAYDPQRQRGAVVLANSKRQLADLAFHLLDPTRAPEPCGHPEPAPIALAAEALEDYVGNFRFPDGELIRVTRDGAKLHAQSHGRPRALLPIESDRFYSSKFKVTLSFLRDASGRVQGLYFQHSGLFLKATRVS
jgi:CubicO group peptidase (beta-lactamase class C family)